VESADDILEELGLPSAGSVTSQDGPDMNGKGSAGGDPVLACLTPGEPSDLDEISERSGLQPPRLLPRLFELELRGVVRRAGGGRFVRIDRTC
jgi:predicted Rossmann fold nucleotide-binding protein DprA/Smf involved in DNA uptake